MLLEYMGRLEVRRCGEMLFHQASRTMIVSCVCVLPSYGLLAD